MWKAILKVETSHTNGWEDDNHLLVKDDFKLPFVPSIGMYLIMPKGPNFFIKRITYLIEDGIFILTDTHSGYDVPEMVDKYLKAGWKQER
jgi:hypothetical protein